MIYSIERSSNYGKRWAMRTFPLNLDAPAYLLLPGMVCAFDPINGGGDPDSDPEADDEDDDPDDEDDDEDKPKKKGKSEDDDEDDDDEKDDDDFSDPVKARAIVAKARKEARKAKREAREATAAAARAKQGNDDVDKEKEAEARGAKKGLDVAKKASVRAALLSAGLQAGDDKERALKRAMRLVDLDDLEVDDDGTIDGLEEAIEDLKDDYPAMFRRKKAPGRISGQDTGGTGRGRDKKLSASELQAQQLTGSK